MGLCKATHRAEQGLFGGNRAMTMASPRSFLRFAVALVVVLTASTAFAQNTGSLRGVVMDASEGVLPGATVTLLNEGTKESRSTTTNNEGGYFFAAVFPGS